MKENILQLLSQGESVLLIGAGDVGKTYFVLNELIPELEKKILSVLYLKDLEQELPSQEFDILIVDEFETFEDKDYLEENHAEEAPYYPGSYLSQVAGWHKKIRDIKKPMVLLLTRDPGDVQNAAENIHKTDWGLKITPIEFLR